MGDIEQLYPAGFVSGDQTYLSKGQENPFGGEKVSPKTLLNAGVQGVLVAIAYDAGIALAGGPPLTQLEAKADIFSGFLGGMVTPLLAPLIGATAAIIIGAGVIGFLYQMYTAQAGGPPRRSHNAPGSKSTDRTPLVPHLRREEKGAPLVKLSRISLMRRGCSDGRQHQDSRLFPGQGRRTPRFATSGRGGVGYSHR